MILLKGTYMKVRSKRIIKLDRPEPVYDIEVPVVHNFLIDSNIVVHNSDGSKDIADAVCASIWTCSRDITLSASSENMRNLENSIRAITKTSGNALNRFASKLGVR